MAKSSGTLRFRVVVIGASAGGVEALTELVKMLPATLPAAVFVVLHVSSATPSLLPHILKRAGRLPARHARDGELIRPRRIYIAPPDHHLLLNAGRVAVTRGPRENNARPAIDPLFRTAARHYGPTVVGVVLSGTLDDGTLGLMDIKRAGGIALVQDPAEAMFPSMPNSAIENVAVDRVLPLKEMGPLIARLAREPVPIQAGAAFMAARKQSNRPDIAEVGNDNLKNRLMDGPPSQYTCPECGGVLWELKNGNLLRYRCHVGHGFTAESLMAAQTEKLEAAMWGSLRALEEVAGMRRRLAERSRMGGWELIARRYDEQAKTYEDRAAVIRAVLVEERADHIDGQIARSVEQLAAQAEDLDAELGPTDPAAAFGASRPPDPEIGGPMVLGGQSSHSDKSNGRQSGKRTKQRRSG